MTPPSTALESGFRLLNDNYKRIEYTILIFIRCWERERGFQQKYSTLQCEIEIVIVI